MAGRHGALPRNKARSDALKRPVTGRTHLWDSHVQGFFVRAYPSGRKVYALKYRSGRVQRTFTIGVHGSPWTPEAARKAAKDALERVHSGHDPATDKKAARNALTVAALIERYLDDGPATKPGKRASSWVNDASNLRRHVLLILGRKTANGVTKAEAAKGIVAIVEGKTRVDERTGPRGRARVTGGPGVAGRTRTAAAAMFAWGVEHDLVTANPFARMKLAAPPTRERFLTREEAGRFLDALAALEVEGTVSKTFGDALRLLLLTGARKTEILGLRWSHLDFERKILLLPPDRTKAGGSTGERRIVLSPPALAILAGRRGREQAHEAVGDQIDPFIASPYVFPAYRGEGHSVGLHPAFMKVCAKAGLKQVRIHDLRHPFASFAIADGARLYFIAKLMGHASARTTERYAHLGGDPLQEAAAMVGRRIMGGTADAKPVGGVVVDIKATA